MPLYADFRKIWSEVIRVTTREHDELCNYLFSKLTRLENELNHARDVLRYRPADEVDALELMIARVRLVAFKEFFSEVSRVLHLFK